MNQTVGDRINSVTNNVVQLLAPNRSAAQKRYAEEVIRVFLSELALDIMRSTRAQDAKIADNVARTQVTLSTEAREQLRRELQACFSAPENNA